MSSPQIGLFGGSFDPPHIGHQALVAAGLDILGLDEVWVIPALPVHRQLSGCADGQTRLNWLEQIFADEACVRVWDCEIRRARPTPMVETLRQFAAEQGPAIPWLMLGADAWAGLPGWVEYPAFSRLCNIAVFARQAVNMESPPAMAGWQEVDAHDWRHCRQPGNMVYLPVSLPDISATELRCDLAQAGHLAECIPAAIRREVQQAYMETKE